ncbi:MAG: ATP-binding protein [Erysipelotrichales bacterium]|nr:ATP-binding protein [Erysipelotrichales bacterium]
MLERKITKKLCQWKEKEERSPLVILGARGVGKTTSIIHFGKNNYLEVAYLNFEVVRELRMAFSAEMNLKEIMNCINNLISKKIYPEETLLFFDEIQYCPVIIDIMKKIGGDFHCIAASSNLSNIEKNDLEVINMFPLDFEEFLWNVKQENLAKKIQEAFNSNQLFCYHDVALCLFRKYLFMGGMPEVLRRYCKEEQPIFELIRSIQHKLIESFKYNISNVARSQKINKIFKNIAGQLLTGNKKFVLAQLKNHSKYVEYERAFKWLNSAKITLPCYLLKDARLPLMDNIDSNSFKLYFLDCGLLNASYAIGTPVILSNYDEKDEIKMAVAENYVAQSLLAAGFRLFYWQSSGKAKIHFVLETKDNNIFPMEININYIPKSKRLTVFINRFSSKYGIKVTNRNFRYEGNIREIPLYAVHCLSELN